MQSSIYSTYGGGKWEPTMIETVFENRFQHLEEMRRMAIQRLSVTRLILLGDSLQGAEVLSTDLRASTASTLDRSGGARRSCR